MSGGPRTGSARPLLLGAAVLLVAAWLRLHGLASQPLLPDEEEVAASAIHYAAGGQLGPTMWYHPNLRNLAIYAMGETFGYGPMALRTLSLLLGLLTVPLTGLLLLQLTGDRAAALLAAFFLAIDQVHVTFSRQAIQETWTTFLFLAGTALAVAAWRRRSLAALALAGVAFGLGLASKFHAAFPLLVCLGAGLLRARRERSPLQALAILGCLVALPALVFLLTYVPWFARGYGLGDWLEMQRVLLARMATHGGNPMDQTVDTRAWQWFLRPMGYADFTVAGGKPFVTVAYSNPVVWLLVLPAALLGARRALVRGAAAVTGEDQPGERFVLLLFAVCYLPLAAASRPIWLLSSLAVLPFALMLVALESARLARSTRWGRRAVALHAALALAGAVALYPMATGQAKAHAYLAPLVEKYRPAFER